jgi:hypothetical protein
VSLSPRQVAEARRLLTDGEIERSLQSERVVAEALRAAQQDGIVFIDEIDKIVETTRGISGATSKHVRFTTTAGWQLWLLLKACNITSRCVVDWVDVVSIACMVHLLQVFPCLARQLVCAPCSVSAS